MRKREIFAALLLSTLFSAPSQLLAADDFPLGYPFLSWGEVHIGDGKYEEGLVLDSYFEQGIDLYQVGDWVFNSYLGLRLVQSSESGDYWNNKLAPTIGMKLKHSFQFFPGSWGETAFGVRAEYAVYTSSSEKDDFVLTPFFQWSFGGDWRLLEEGVATVNGVFPLAYPFSSWGEIRYSGGGIDEGLVLDSYFEQGVDWCRWQGFTLNSFMAFRLVQSNQSEDYWNNKFAPVLGVKAKHPFELFPGSWGETAFGVRGEYYTYTSSAASSNDLRVLLFAQWSFGGDLKNKQ